MVTRRSVKTAATAVAIALLLAACSGGGNDADEQPLKRLTPVERTVQTNPDRNAAEVAEKAAAIDPCALLAAGAAAGGKRDPDPPKSTTPHTCDDEFGVLSGVKVEILTGLAAGSRYSLKRIEVGGAVAYRNEPGDGTCVVHLPVSHDHAISFSGPAKCATTTAYAEAAARLLQDDPSAAARPAGLARVPACDLITAAGLVPEPHTLLSSSLDECGVATPSINLRLFYGETDGYDEQTEHRVAGTTVLTDKSDRTCYLTIPLGPADIATDEGDVLTAVANTRTCGDGLKFAQKLIRGARTVARPDRAPVGLLYAWDEPDTSVAGACADVFELLVPIVEDLACTPAEDAEVPDDRRDLIMQAEADPNVLCAAAAPIVRDHYGDAFMPVTALAPVGAQNRGGDATQCAFGSPAHTLDISIVLSTASAGVETDDTVGGHPALIKAMDFMPTTADRTYLLAREDSDKPGLLRVRLQVWPERGGDGFSVPATRAKPDTTLLKNSQAFVGDLADALL